MASTKTSQHRHRSAGRRRQPEPHGPQKLVNAVRQMLPGSASKGRKGSSLPLVGDLLSGSKGSKGSKGAKGSKGRHGQTRRRGTKPALMGAAGAGVAGAAAYATRRKRAGKKEPATPVGGPV